MALYWGRKAQFQGKLGQMSKCHVNVLCLKGVIQLVEKGGDIFILIEDLCYQ